MLSTMFEQGVLELLISLVEENHTDKEVLGCLMTAISYMSLHKPARQVIDKNKFIKKALTRIPDLHEIDQKMEIIALGSMLFNDLSYQSEFIRQQGMTKLIYFLQKPDKVFH